MAPIGGFGKQYQVNVDPSRLQAYNIAIGKVVDAIRSSNNEAGGRMLELGGAEYMVRGRGYAKSATDLENVVVAASENGTPVRVRDIGRAVLGARDYTVNSYLNEDAAVAMVVFQRPGSNALATAERVLETMEDLRRDFPEGLDYRVVYNPTVFIQESIDAVNRTLFEAAFLVVLVIFLFLQGWRATVIPLVAIPVSLIAGIMTGAETYR